MKKLLNLLPLLLILTSCQAMKHFNPLPFKENAEIKEKEDLTSQFEFSTSSYDRTGYVYHYIKSNQDDSFQTHVWIYYPDRFNSESFKIYPVSKLQGFLDCVCASYDSSTFQIKNIDAKRVLKSGEIKSGLLASYENYVRTVTMGKKELKMDLGICPTYDINFDLADMNSMLPYLKDVKSDFSFGLTNVKKEHLLGSASFLYLGKLKCKYLNEETYKDKTCSVYDMKLQNYEDLEGKLYIDTSTNDVVEINTKLSGNPFYNSFKFSLQDKKKITRDEWLSFMKEKAKENL